MPADSINDDTVLVKTGEPLNEDLFWDIVEKSLKNTNNQNDQENLLIKEIEKLSPKQIVGFRLFTDKLLYDSYKADIWCAAYLIEGGCSDDSFEYFRCWLISRGRKTYHETMINPDYLIKELKSGDEFYEFEGFWFVALSAFRNKTGKELYNFIDYDKFQTHEGNYPRIEETWKEDDPESMKKICPKLFGRFYKE
jgi:hypothetical protein